MVATTPGVVVTQGASWPVSKSPFTSALQLGVGTEVFVAVAVGGVPVAVRVGVDVGPPGVTVAVAVAEPQGIYPVFQSASKTSLKYP